MVDNLKLFSEEFEEQGNPGLKRKSSTERSTGKFFETVGKAPHFLDPHKKKHKTRSKNNLEKANFKLNLTKKVGEFVTTEYPRKRSLDLQAPGKR